MNIIDLFIDICCFSDHKNETLTKFLNLDNKKNTNNLIRPKLLQLKKGNFSSNKKNKINQNKNFSDLIYEIADNSLEKYNYIGNELEFIKSKNNDLNLEKLSVLYKYYPDKAICNVDLIYKNFKNNNYIFDNIYELKQSNVEIKSNFEELNKLNSKISLLSIQNRSLQDENKNLKTTINKVLKSNSKFEKENENLNIEKNKLINDNIKLKEKIKLLEKNINYYEKISKNSIIIDKSFSEVEKINFCMIHNSNLVILPKIHTDINFIKYKDINFNEIENFLNDLKIKNINYLFIQSNNINQIILRDIIEKSKKKNLKCFRIFFSSEKELNEKLCKLK